MNQWSTTPTLLSPAGLKTKEFDEVREIRALRPLNSWNPERFAQAQVRGLVRKVFLSSDAVRQVVLSAIEPDTEVRSVCRRIGEELARENVGDVAVVERVRRIPRGTVADAAPNEHRDAMRPCANRIRENLWLASGPLSDNHVALEELHSHLSGLKRDFEFSILEVAPVGHSDEAIVSARAADGIILVLSARHTRRVTASSVKQMLALANVRILGAVLADRTFPIPEKIYQRL